MRGFITLLIDRRVQLLERRRGIAPAGAVTVVFQAVHVSSYLDTQPFVTLDGSEIREWAGRVSAPARNQSLAEATVPVGGVTIEHYHRVSEELYLITAGEGRLT